MYEIKKNNSFWAPYLALCPSFDEFNQPMFWSEEERHEELAGLSVLWDVQRDLYNIEREYQQFAVPFIEENKDRMRYRIIYVLEGSRNHMFWCRNRQYHAAGIFTEIRVSFIFIV